MKSPAESRPRFTCRLARRHHARHAADDARPPQIGWAGRHVEQCAACQQYFAAAARLDADLRSEARAARAASHATAVPAGLEDRIWAAVQTDREMRHGARRRRQAATTPAWSWRPLMQGSLAAAVVAVMVWFTLQPRGQSVTEAEINQADLQALAASIEDYSSQLLAAGATGRADSDVPSGALEAEWGALKGDTRSALRFLRDNFVPTGRMHADPATTSS